MGITARAATIDELAACEPLLERLDFPDEARDALSEAAGIDPEALGTENAWAASVTFDDTTLIVRAEDGRWTILAPADSDEAVAMHAARRLHGILGQKGADWDLDR